LFCYLHRSIDRSNVQLHESREDRGAVPVVRVTRQTLERDLTIAAEFRAYQEVNLHAKVAVFLRQICVDVGDHVAAGDLIATLEVPQMVDEEAQADASQKRSEADLIRVQPELARARSMHEAAHVAYQLLADVAQARPNLIVRQELDDALAKDKSAEAQVDTAVAAITSVRAADSRDRSGPSAYPDIAGVHADHRAVCGSDHQALRGPWLYDSGRHLLEQPGHAGGDAIAS